MASENEIRKALGLPPVQYRPMDKFEREIAGPIKEPRDRPKHAQSTKGEYDGLKLIIKAIIKQMKPKTYEEIMEKERKMVLAEERRLEMQKAKAHIKEMEKAIKLRRRQAIKQSFSRFASIFKK